MFNAITTKYRGPTNVRGARIIASNCDGLRVTIPYPHELSGADCHRAAADALCAKMGWTLSHHGTLVCGAIKGGYAFVFSGDLEIL